MATEWQGNTTAELLGDPPAAEGRAVALVAKVDEDFGALDGLLPLDRLRMVHALRLVDIQVATNACHVLWVPTPPLLPCGNETDHGRDGCGQRFH